MDRIQNIEIYSNDFMREYSALMRIRKSVPRSIYWGNAQMLVARYSKVELLSIHSRTWNELNSYVNSELQVQNNCIDQECPGMAEQMAIQKRMRDEMEEFSNDGNDVLFKTSTTVKEDIRDAATPSFIDSDDDEESEELPFPLDDVFCKVKMVHTNEG